MNPQRCCREASRDAGDVRARGSWTRRAREIAGLVLPGTFLALLPKCPMCLAAYVALGTGFTMSCASAHILMRTMTVLCISALAISVARRIMKHLHQEPFLNLQTTSTPK